MVTVPESSVDANSASQRHLAAVNSPGAAIDLHLAADAPSGRRPLASGEGDLATSGIIGRLACSQEHIAASASVANPHGQGDRTPSAASRRARCQGKGACVACIRGARPESHVAANTGRARVGGCNGHGARVRGCANTTCHRNCTSNGVRPDTSFNYHGATGTSCSIRV